MVTKKQESGGFSRTLGVVEDLIRRTLLQQSETHSATYAFPHVTYNVNEADIVTGLQSAYVGSKVTRNWAEDLSIKYRTNLSNYLEEAGKGPAATHICNIQRIKEYCTMAICIKYIEGKFRKSGITFVT